MIGVLMATKGHVEIGRACFGGHRKPRLQPFPHDHPPRDVDGCHRLRGVAHNFHRQLGQLAPAEPVAAVARHLGPDRFRLGRRAHDADHGVQTCQVARRFAMRVVNASTSPESAARLRIRAAVAISNEPSSLGGEHALRGEMGRRSSVVSARSAWSMVDRLGRTDVRTAAQGARAVVEAADVSEGKRSDAAWLRSALMAAKGAAMNALGR